MSLERATLEFDKFTNSIVDGFSKQTKRLIDKKIQSFTNERDIGDGAEKSIYADREKKIAYGVPDDGMSRRLNQHTNTRPVTIKSSFLQNFFYTDHRIEASFLGKQDLASYLEELQDNEEDLTYEEAKSIALQILLGLSDLHEKGFVHLDLKPENIIILDSNLEGFPYILIQIIDISYCEVRHIQKQLEEGRPVHAPKMPDTVFYYSKEKKESIFDVAKASQNPFGLDIHLFGKLIETLRAFTSPKKGILFEIPELTEFGKKQWPIEKLFDLECWGKFPEVRQGYKASMIAYHQGYMSKNIKGFYYTGPDSSQILGNSLQLASESIRNFLLSYESYRNMLRSFIFDPYDDLTTQKIMLSQILIKSEMFKPSNVEFEQIIKDHKDYCKEFKSLTHTILITPKNEAFIALIIEILQKYLDLEQIEADRLICLNKLEVLKKSLGLSASTHAKYDHYIELFREKYIALSHELDRGLIPLKVKIHTAKKKSKEANALTKKCISILSRLEVIVQKNQGVLDSNQIKDLKSKTLASQQPSLFAFFGRDASLPRIISPSEATDGLEKKDGIVALL